MSIIFIKFNQENQIKFGRDQIQHKSDGGFVFYEEPRTHKLFIALIQPEKDGHLFIPKGHIKKGETPEQAAVREISVVIKRIKCINTRLPSPSIKEVKRSAVFDRLPEEIVGGKTPAFLFFLESTKIKDTDEQRSRKPDNPKSDVSVISDSLIGARILIFNKKGADNIPNQKNNQERRNF